MKKTYQADNNRSISKDVSENMMQHIDNSLPIELQIFGTIGWESLATTINQCQEQLRHHIEGEILCTFIVSYLNGNRKTKISYVIFNNGMDCLKSFLELLLDENIGVNPIIKNGFKILFDFYKEKTKESFRKENLLSYP